MHSYIFKSAYCGSLSCWKTLLLKASSVVVHLKHRYHYIRFTITLLCIYGYNNRFSTQWHHGTMVQWYIDIVALYPVSSTLYILLVLSVIVNKNISKNTLLLRRPLRLFTSHAKPPRHCAGHTLPHVGLTDKEKSNFPPRNTPREYIYTEKKKRRQPKEITRGYKSFKKACSPVLGTLSHPAANSHKIDINLHLWKQPTEFLHCHDWLTIFGSWLGQTPQLRTCPTRYPLPHLLSNNQTIITNHQQT